MRCVPFWLARAIFLHPLLSGRRVGRGCCVYSPPALAPISHVHHNLMRPRRDQPGWANAQIATLRRTITADQFQREHMVHPGDVVDHLQNLCAVDIAPKGPAVALWSALQRIKKAFRLATISVCTRLGSLRGFVCTVAFTRTSMYCGPTTSRRVPSVRRRFKKRHTACSKPGLGVGRSWGKPGTMTTVTVPGALAQGYAGSSPALALARSTCVPGVANASRS